MLLVLVASVSSVAQALPGGRIVGTVTDPQGARLVGATITVRNVVTGDDHRSLTDGAGHYEVPSLPSGRYVVILEATGFARATVADVAVSEPDGVTVVDVRMSLAGLNAAVEVGGTLEAILKEGPTIARAFDAASVSDLPLATRNFTQLVGLVAGASTYLNNNTLRGRQSLPVTVNGARVTQNNFQINGIDANDITGNGPSAVAVPAPETLQELTVRTSLYDATVGPGAGAVIEAITRSGGQSFRGEGYGYFRNEALNANAPSLKAVGISRPTLRRGVFGTTFGGPIRTGRGSFFASYQGTREKNGFDGIFSNVLIAPGLTDDRSETTLLATFAPTLPDGSRAASIHPAALGLLNARLPDGSLLLPTPQAGGRVSGFARSTFREDQFNTNLDQRFGVSHGLDAKFFFANAPAFDPLGANSLPGFGVHSRIDNRVLSINDTQTFRSNTANELRLGYSFIQNQEVPDQPLNDAALGIERSTAGIYPGLPMIQIASSARGATIGSPLINVLGRSSVVSVRDVLSMPREHHALRVGGEIRWYRNDFHANAFSRGLIDFPTFNDFLTGQVGFSFVGSGLGNRNMRATDYNFFVQDDWRVSARLSLSLGTRYELDLPPYDTRGRYSTFDPSLYKPPPGGVGGFAGGPPSSGLVQAGNAPPEYDLPDVPNVGARLVRSIEPSNLAPRVGLTWSPSASAGLVVHGGYGLFHTRSAFEHANISLITAPFFTTAVAAGSSFEAPFPALPPPDAFPQIVPGGPLSGPVIDRDLRTPYFEHFNVGVQSEIGGHMRLELAYVGSRGHRLLRQVATNQARLASPTTPIVNGVTGEVITTNTIGNADLRAPFQGVLINQATGFVMTGSSGRSVYHSLQASLDRHFSHGLQFLASYTLSKSSDDSSASGGGAGSDGTLDILGSSDSAAFAGDQIRPGANFGRSDFDRTHRLVISYAWTIPTPAAWRAPAIQTVFSDWQIAGILTAMSGLPIDVVDSVGGSIYGLQGARPNWVPGADPSTAIGQIPAGYFFNPAAFAQALLRPGQPIPSANGAAVSDDYATDIGDVSRNVLRGPRQINLDFAVTRRFKLSTSRSLELRGDFFNLLNQVNFANPISDISAVTASGGEIDPETGRILKPGDFGRIISTSNSPRIIQIALRIHY